MKTNSQPPLLKAKSCLSTEGEIAWQIKYLVPGPSQSLTKSLSQIERFLTPRPVLMPLGYDTLQLLMSLPLTFVCNRPLRYKNSRAKQTTTTTTTRNHRNKYYKKHCQKKIKWLEKPSYELTDNTLVARICLWRSVSCWILYSSSEIWACSHVQRLPILALSASHFHSEV